MAHSPALRRLAPGLLLALLAPFAAAQVPAGYYNPVDTTNAATLRATLHALIDDHTRIPYTSGGTDTWDVLESADQNPANATQILDLYGNQVFTKQGGGNTFYNREHTWPNSYGFPNDGADNYPYTDCHQLFLCDIVYNADRGNHVFRSCSSSCDEDPTVANGGQGGGSGTYLGNSNWFSTSPAGGTWETWRGRRGDVARALFYLDVRYAGGTHGITGHAEPDLILTDNVTLITNSATGNNESVAYMGLLSTLLVWNRQDPPDAKERTRNGVVQGAQGNRNPFIDHPEWAECLFAGSCLPGQAFCFGSGIDTSHTTACPCGNAGASTNGCAHSFSALGANLTATGRTSVDNVVLRGTNVPSTSFSLFLQHDATGDQLFHDGVLCASGTLIRLRGRAAAAGAINFPDTAFAQDQTITLSQRGLVTIGSGARRFYSVWYRNASTSFCPPATANVSNGFQIVW